MLFKILYLQIQADGVSLTRVVVNVLVRPSVFMGGSPTIYKYPLSNRNLQSVFSPPSKKLILNVMPLCSAAIPLNLNSSDLKTGRDYDVTVPTEHVHNEITSRKKQQNVQKWINVSCELIQYIF